jgi:catechol 2,3-dioxygenase-like lactoylglutathione lyase family enzyme
MTNALRFTMHRLDHVHIRVPDRAAAAAWYGEHLGFEPVETFAFWARGFEGGPLQISADGGVTTVWAQNAPTRAEVMNHPPRSRRQLRDRSPCW